MCERERIRNASLERGKGEEGLAEAVAALPGLGLHPFCRGTPPAVMHSGAKIPLGGQTEPKLCHQQREEMLEWL